MRPTGDDGSGIDVDAAVPGVGDPPAIELDIAEDWEPGEPPVRRWSARWPRALAALLVVVALLAADASALRARLLMRRPTAAMQLAVDAAGIVYAWTGQAVDAYRLPDGRRQWHLLLDPVAPTEGQGIAAPAGDEAAPADDQGREAAERVGMHPGQGLLLVNQASPAPGAVRLRAVDAASGGRLWSRDGLVGLGTAGTVVVALDPAGSAAAGGGQRRYLGIDARSGAQLWQRTAPATEHWHQIVGEPVTAWTDAVATAAMIGIDPVCAGTGDTGRVCFTTKAVIDAQTGELRRITLVGPRSQGSGTAPRLTPGEVIVFSADGLVTWDQAGAVTTTQAPRGWQSAGILPDGWQIIVWYGQDGAGAGRTIAAFHPKARGLTRLATSRVPLDRSVRCQAAGDLLACADGAVLQAWRIG